MLPQNLILHNILYLNQNQERERLHLVELYKSCQLMAFNSSNWNGMHICCISVHGYKIGSVGNLYRASRIAAVTQSLKLEEVYRLELQHLGMCLFIPRILIIRTKKFICSYEWDLENGGEIQEKLANLMTFLASTIYLGCLLTFSITGYKTNSPLLQPNMYKSSSNFHADY